MNEPRVTPQADADLLEVWCYVAKGGEARADAFLDKVLKQFRQLAQFPRMGRDRSSLAANLRSFAVKPFVIFYRPVDDTVEIVRILYGARDIETIFERETPSGDFPEEDKS
jgi:toxin ParE1/3/4